MLTDALRSRNQHIRHLQCSGALNRFSALYSTYARPGGDSDMQHPAVPQVGVPRMPLPPAYMQQPRDGMMRTALPTD
jgi:hypothetical protein